MPKFKTQAEACRWTKIDGGNSLGALVGLDNDKFVKRLHAGGHIKYCSSPALGKGWAVVARIPELEVIVLPPPWES